LIAECWEEGQEGKSKWRKERGEVGVVSSLRYFGFPPVHTFHFPSGLLNTPPLLGSVGLTTTGTSPAWGVAPAVVHGGFDILGVLRNLSLPYVSFSSWGLVFSTSQPTCSVVLDSLDGLPAVNTECFLLL
jgi:hypothetical protein